MANYISNKHPEDILPLVSIAMPVYNAGKHLRLAVLSIVNQTYLNWELLIIDDGSSDDSFLDIADINDWRITILRDAVNRGLVARLNEAIDLARGDYFARMDGDDISYPDRLLKQVTALQNNSKIDLIATRVITIDEENLATGLFPYAISHNEICACPWKGFYFPHPTWMGKIEWFRKYRYKLPAPYCCEDQELILRSYRDSRLETLNEILLAYRVRSIVDKQKLAKTRRAVFEAQLTQFYSYKSWCFLLLAVVSFMIKSINDFLNRIKNKNNKTAVNRLDHEILVKWNKVLDSLNLLKTVL